MKQFFYYLYQTLQHFYSSIVESILHDTEIIVKTPNRKIKSCVCNVNMLNLFVTCSRSDVYSPAPPASPVSAASVTALASESPNSDGLSISSACLPNLGSLSNIQAKLAHLTDLAQGDLISLNEKYESFLSNTPSPTAVLKYDINLVIFLLSNSMLTMAFLPNALL